MGQLTFVLATLLGGVALVIWYRPSLQASMLPHTRMISTRSTHRGGVVLVILERPVGLESPAGLENPAGPETQVSLRAVTDTGSRARSTDCGIVGSGIERREVSETFVRR